MSILSLYFQFLGSVNAHVKLPVVNLIVNRRYSYFERWLLNSIGLAVMVCGIYVCVLQSRRYRANPTVVSVERDFYDWNGTLPSITFCVHADTVDQADTFIKATWNPDDNDTYLYLSNFLSTLVDSNIYSLTELLPYIGDPSLRNIDFKETIQELLPEPDYFVGSFLKAMDLQPQAIQTEMGVCYTVNSVQSDILSLHSDSHLAGVRKSSPILCYFALDQCFMKLDIFGLNASIAIHSYYEPVRYETFFYQVRHEDEIATTFKLLETINDDSVRDLSFAQRNCLFYDEKQENWGRNIEDIDESYSLNLCLLKCRAEAAIALCGCKPHFYPFMASKKSKTCNLADIECLVSNAWPTNVREDECNCPKTCNLLMYSESSFKISSWNVEDNGIPFAQKSSFRVEVLWPRLRLRREVLFTFEDLLVSFGGAVTFFIGLNIQDAGMLIFYVIQFAINGLRQWAAKRSV